MPCALLLYANYGIFRDAARLEVQIMRGINHPSIVKLLSFSESQEHYFLVLECEYECISP